MYRQFVAAPSPVLPTQQYSAHVSISNTMVEGSIAAGLFDHLAEHALAICKECRHGVLSSQIKSHLQRAHSMSSKQAESAAEEVGSWAGLIQYASELEVPSQAVPPMPQLPVYPDGLECRLDPDQCRQIFRSPEAMRKHWRKPSRGGEDTGTHQESLRHHPLPAAVGSGAGIAVF
jgi:hypothetical protein